MSEKASETRARILDAFEQLVIDHGERAATVAGTAEAAGVSKGGLLYHFGSKAQLVDGLVDRLAAFAEHERTRFATLDDPVESFLRESVAANGPIDRTIIALLRLGQLDEHAVAREAFLSLDATYEEILTERLGNAELAELIVRLSDGLYLRSLLVDEVGDTDVDTVVATLTALIDSRGRAGIQAGAG